MSQNSFLFSAKLNAFNTGLQMYEKTMELLGPPRDGGQSMCAMLIAPTHLD